MRKEGLFPLFAAVIAFILFLLAYFLVTCGMVVPYYAEGFLFAVPFLIFGTLAFLAVRGKIGKRLENVLTGILAPVCLLFCIACFMCMMFSAAVTTVTDPVWYQRAVRKSSFSAMPVASFLPGEVPADAQEVQFAYTPAFLQGGERLYLRYTADGKSVRGYTAALSEAALWTGTYSALDDRMKSMGLSGGNSLIPDSWDVYLLYERPYQEKNWNHGTFCLAAVCTPENGLMFLYERW